MSDVLYKQGERVRVWATKDAIEPSGYRQVIEVSAIDQITKRNPSELSSYEKVDVEFVGYVYKNEVIVSVPAGFFGWDFDATNLEPLADHPKNAKAVDFTKYFGTKCLYMYAGSIVCRAVEAVAARREGPDGMNCCQCNEFSPMACANVGDKFKCFQCRQDRFRMSY